MDIFNGEKLSTRNHMYKVAISGPESTGKSTLAESLASHYNAPFVPEYARTYIEQLNRPYTYSDVETIALKQFAAIDAPEWQQPGILFLDTCPIITKVWFDVVYKRRPEWLHQAIANSGIAHYLVCNTDIPWVKDPVRENGGEMRNVLFNQYIHEIESYGFPYSIIEGTGFTRTDNAIKVIDKYKKLWRNDQ